MQFKQIKQRFNVNLIELLIDFSYQSQSDLTSDLATAFLTFLPKNLAFSSFVWKRPWPSLLLVSMNLMLTFSRDCYLVLGMRLFLSTRTRFFVPTTPPLIMRKSFLTVPQRTKPPKGVIYLSVRSVLVEAFLRSSPLATLQTFLLVSVLWWYPS